MFYVQIIASPAVGDFNLDGHLDVSYGIVWTPVMSVNVPMLKVFTFTLEDRFRQVYQQEEKVKGQPLVDFDEFLPADQQPWNRYMGHHGNSTFSRKAVH